MKNIHRLALASVVSLSLGSTAMAAQQQPVAELLQVSGKALIETTDGKRQVAKKGMPLTEGSHIVVLEKSKITVGYLSSDCKVIHQQNTLLTIQAAEQCAAGQPLAVGAAGAAAVPPKTVAAGKAAAIPPIMKGMGVGGLGAGSLNLGAGSLAPAAIGVVAVAALAASSSDDDDDIADGTLSGLSLASGFFDRNGDPILVNAAGVPVDSNGTPVPAGVNAGIFNADGALVDSTGTLITPYVDGNGNAIPVNKDGAPLDSDGEPVTNLAAAGVRVATTGNIATNDPIEIAAGPVTDAESGTTGIIVDLGDNGGNNGDNANDNSGDNNANDNNNGQGTDGNQGNGNGNTDGDSGSASR